MNSSEQNPKMEEKDTMDELTSSKNLLSCAFFRSPLNQKIAIFITNPSKNKSKGSSLYFVSPHGTIRCRSDHTNEDRPPYTTTYPFIIGYNKHHKPITTLEATIGFYPFEAKPRGSDERGLDFLNFVKENMKIAPRAFHFGHTITEIISLEQFNEPKFMPKTWVNREDLGLPWSFAVNHIKEAEKTALLNIDGHFIQKETIIPVNIKKMVGCSCSIS